jgi:indole-3-glycerol phosphate synthase
VIREPFDPARIARDYEAAGAQAVSVLMDERFFGGGEDDFRSVREAVGLPLLYKEFVIDPWQVWHAASLGASAVLLLAAALDRPTLRALGATCRMAGVEPLVEVHTRRGVERGSHLWPCCMGVNSRNLRTFRIDLGRTLRLKPMIADSCTLIAESGIRSNRDIKRLHRAGVHAVLVGECLLRQPDLKQAVRDLMDGVWNSS